MKKNILSNISEIAKHSENISFKVIANFILENLNDINNYNIFDISNQTNTSASTVTRFCKFIGLDGFKKLISEIEINQWILNKNENSNQIIDHDKQYFNNIIEALNNSYNENDATIPICIKKIIQSKNIYIFAKGGNIFLALLFNDWLTRIGKFGIFSTDTDQQNAYASLTTKDDCSIIISYSLTSSFFEKVSEKLHLNKVKNIFITKNNLSNLIHEDDFVIKLVNNEDIIVGRQSAEVATLFLLKKIFFGLLSESQINTLKITDVLF